MESFSTKMLADEVVSGLGERLPDVLGPGGGLGSVCVCGSYVRGDFMDHNSDIDLFLVGEPEATGDPYSCPAFHAVRDLVASLLDGRKLHSHNPTGFDWVVVPHAGLPRRTQDIRVPPSRPSIRLLNIFLFDLLENLLVLWGADPRNVLPDPPNVRALASQWFARARNSHAIHLERGTEFRIPMTAFNSIHVAQIVFGERTLDKRRLLDLYRRHVPAFPLKDFGIRMIESKLNQRYPHSPPTFAPWAEYIEFETQLARVVGQEVGG